MIRSFPGSRRSVYKLRLDLPAATQWIIAIAGLDSSELVPHHSPVVVDAPRPLELVSCIMSDGCPRICRCWADLPPAGMPRWS